jgi:hypothetical protein
VSSKEERRRLAGESMAFNIRNPTFKKLFPEVTAGHEERVKAAAAAAEKQQERQMPNAIPLALGSVGLQQQQ